MAHPLRPDAADSSRLEDAVARELLPTPLASDAKHGDAANREGGRSLGVTVVDALLPTPNAADGSGGRHNADGHQQTLPGTVRTLPTPTTQDAANNGGPSQLERNTPPLNAVVAQLLPTPTAQDANASGRSPAQPDAITLTDATVRDARPWGTYAPAIARWEAVRGQAPDPTEPNSNGNPRLSPRFVEWMMGLSPGHVTGAPIGRPAQLKALGNGVVPQQAAEAFGWILERNPEILASLLRDRTRSGTVVT